MYSIYTNVSKSVTEQMIKDEFANTLGTVSRVDFSEIGKKPGFKDSGFKHPDNINVFVHFDNLYDTVYYDSQRKENIKVKNIKQILDSNESFIYNPCRDTRYWKLLKNKIPTPQTQMNIHQVVANCRVLEKRVENLEEDYSQIEKFIGDENNDFGNYIESIEMLNDRVRQQQEIIYRYEKEITQLSRNVSSIQQTVSQLIGGLFNKKTQEGIKELHLDILLGTSENCEKYDNNTSKWENSPTTEQGDFNEKRIEAIEKLLGINNYEYNDEYHEVNDDEESINSISS